MDLKPLKQIYSHRIFRIPDYQRGYAWQKEHLRDFWEDLVNLESDRNHYTGMLTLKSIPDETFEKDSEEYWLLDDQGYRAFHIVDGQQRLTTFVIFIQSLIETIKNLPENFEKDNHEIFLGHVKLSEIIEDFLVKEQEPDRIVKTYKFGYTVDHQTGSHLILYHPSKPTLSIPNHKELAPGLLRALLRKSSITVEEFLSHT